MKVLSCHHTGITVKNLERSVAWYCEMLGFKVLLSFESNGPGIAQVTGIPNVHIKGTHLQLGDYDVELIEYVSPQGKEVDLSTSYIGSGHIGLMVDDVQGLYEQLKAKGVRFKGAPIASRPGRLPVCYFLDPDGVPLELMQAPK